MNRSKKTMANAITQVITICVQGLLILVVTRELLRTVGSDANGITSTATQLLMFLSLLEGGFSIASLVKLYKPYGERDYDKVNQYLSLTGVKFRKIGIWYLVVGVIISLAYAPFVKTGTGFWVTVCVLLLSVLSSSFNVYHVSKYRLVFQVTQTEYVVHIIQLVSNILMYITEIILLRAFKSIVIARICVCAFQMATGVTIGIVAKWRYKFINYRVDSSNVRIDGTKDVFAGKVCGLLYSTTPVLFISTFIGTAYTSVYSVYYATVNTIGTLINACLVAPRSALGHLVNSKDRSAVIKVFNEYEFIAALAVALLYSVTFAMLLPFVKMYTAGLVDLNYTDPILAILLVLDGAVHFIHFPAGVCIEVSARFKAARNIQTVGAIIVLVCAVVGALTFGLYGIICAKFITSLFLCIAEMLYVRRKILEDSIASTLRIVLPSLLVAGICSAVEFYVLSTLAMTVTKFIICGAVLVLINAALIFAVNALVNKVELRAAFMRIKAIVRK